MKQSLQVRLSQHLALTPQLQQSIRLLQLSTLELNQEVEQMLAQNPLLETEDDFSVATPELKAEDFGNSEREDWENGTEGDDFDGIRELPSNSGSGSGSNDEDGERSDTPCARGAGARPVPLGPHGHAARFRHAVRGVKVPLAPPVHGVPRRSGPDQPTPARGSCPTCTPRARPT